VARVPRCLAGELMPRHDLVFRAAKREEPALLPIWWLSTKARHRLLAASSRPAQSPLREDHWRWQSTSSGTACDMSS
jgi:hypothetical protein